MSVKDWIRAPRLPLFLFLGIVVVSTATLGWLTWRLVEQDRDLENQRTRERLESAADVVASALTSLVEESEDRLRWGHPLK